MKAFFLSIPLFLSFTSFAAEPSPEDLKVFSLECRVEKIKRDDIGNLKSNSKIEFYTFGENPQVAYEVDGEASDLLAGFPIEEVNSNGRVITISGSQGSILIRNKLSGKMTYDTQNRTATFEANNRVWIPTVGYDKVILDFSVSNCVQKY